MDRVLVKRIEPPTKSIGGVLLPESSQTKLNQGIVLSVGPGRRDADGKLIAMDLKKDDTVLQPGSAWDKGNAADIWGPSAMAIL